MKRLFLIYIFTIPLVVEAQQTLRLEECFELVAESYPLAKQSGLLEKQVQLDIDALRTGFLPKLDLNAQATYQSDVTSLPIQLPNVSVEPPNKDQYRATLDVNQMIYNGGLINASSKVKVAASKVNQQQLEVSLYGLKSQVNSIYLSVLLLQENQALLQAKEEQLKARIADVRAGVKYGTLLTSSEKTLEAELLKLKQQYIELSYNKSDLLQRLSLLIGRELSSAVNLLRPEVFMSEDKPKRPEIQLFDLQKEQIDYSLKLISKSNLPKVNAFAQGGYGNPGLNMLDNSFNTFYMAGLKLNMNIFDWNKTKTEKQSLEINKEIIDTQKETFELNNNLELVTLKSEIDKIDALISTDNEIIALREDILKTAESQLNNGVITASAYIIEFTNLYEAKSNLNLHETQLLLHQIQYEITKGSYYNN
ncbi:TolC family protein [Arenibacter sp. ARW7G5Y1]|uniref:TolC family protein n=1 Tax=Arenibacter sp. ARW7G5Y1 TaxID=2135619 RepID=UPI000D757197|nr:TolC family protein [Arenibacter sp. ARW7G5Y1]PXX31268.1 outer membrane protein TolC [Arenibacter sp. ARW7G5Y1]